MYSSVIWLMILLIIICIKFQPDRHIGDLVEAYCLSLPGHVQQHIISKRAIYEDYIMLDALPTIIKDGAEYEK